MKAETAETAPVSPAPAGGAAPYDVERVRADCRGSRPVRGNDRLPDPPIVVDHFHRPLGAVPSDPAEPRGGHVRLVVVEDLRHVEHAHGPGAVWLGRSWVG